MEDKNSLEPRSAFSQRGCARGCTDGSGNLIILVLFKTVQLSKIIE